MTEDEVRRKRREGQIELARVLFTETRMSMPKMSAEVGITTSTIWKWARDLGWVRPPKEAFPKPLRVSPTEYRKRYLRELGIGLDAIPASPAKDPFKVTDRVACADAKEKRERRLAELRAKAIKLWQAGLGLDVIAIRVGRTEGHVRELLRREGMELGDGRRERWHGKTPYRSRMSQKAIAGNWQRRT